MSSNELDHVKKEMKNEKEENSKEVEKSTETTTSDKQKDNESDLNDSVNSTDDTEVLVTNEKSSEMVKILTEIIEKEEASNEAKLEEEIIG